MDISGRKQRRRDPLALGKEKGKFKDLDRLFNPSSIAIVGVSAEGAGFGRGILLSHIAIGYEGKLYPVNRSGGAVAGIPIYPSVEDIPGDIDFAIIAVPAHTVPGVIEACRKKGAAGVEVLSAGFGESGTPEGAALEEELKACARKGIRVVGPNCFGIYCPRSGQTLLPGPDLSREPGGVAFLSQSGGHSIDVGHIGKWRGVRFSKVVSFGNGCDLRETEMLRYLLQDRDTKIICMYIEGVADGREFFSALKETCRKKPVVVVKGGLSESGSRAAASHTASLSGQRGIWEAVLRQCNATQAESIEEMMDAALSFSLLPERAYRGCTIMGGGGALGIAAADAAESFGLTIPRLRQDLQASIMEVLPKPGSSAANPIDIANPHVPPEIIKEVLIRASEDENVDIHIVISLLYHLKSLKIMLGAKTIREISPHRELAEACREAMERGKKPVMLILPNHKQEEDSIEIEEIIRETRRLFVEAGMPVYDDVKNALRAIASVSKYYRRRSILARGAEGESRKRLDIGQDSKELRGSINTIKDALARGESALNEHESKMLLNLYSIPVTEEYIATSLEEALVSAGRIGYPVALKGSSRTLTHKTEHHLIELGIDSDDALRKAYEVLQERGRGQLDGVLVQQMIKGGRELVAGLIRDPQFGPCVMFGLGGIFTEVLKDVTFRVAPLQIQDALDMMDEIKARKVLDRFRGKPAVHRKILACTLINLGKIGLDIDEVAEIDINPLIVHGETPVAVDALVILRKQSAMKQR